eukprot:2957475-Amphidinium_carterae.1
MSQLLPRHVRREAIKVSVFKEKVDDSQKSKKQSKLVSAGCSKLQAYLAPLQKCLESKFRSYNHPRGPANTVENDLCAQ